jgi:hypothetical protein
MENNWLTWLPIIAKHGVEFAFRLWGNIKNNNLLTEDEWNVLIGLSEKTYDDYLVEARRRAGQPNVTTNPNP